jgi:hydrogenase nickel incorporation protein HypA/HybF
VHECSVVEQVVRIARKHAEESHAKKVKAISLVVGEMTGYMEESLKFYFGVLTRDTELAGAELKTTYVKPLLKCEKCGKLFERKRFSFDCPDCGIPGVMTKTGTEFYMDSMEVED